jgi:hypothetical protein
MICDYCDGEGNIYCTECESLDELEDCLACDGTGYVECPECGGEDGED